MMDMKQLESLRGADLSWLTVSHGITLVLGNPDGCPDAFVRAAMESGRLPGVTFVHSPAWNVHPRDAREAFDTDRLRASPHIAACHNPAVVDCLEFGYPEDVQSQLVLHVGGEWRHPTAQEAAEVLSSYNVGIQHVSEILRSRGLW